MPCWKIWLKEEKIIGKIIWVQLMDLKSSMKLIIKKMELPNSLNKAKKKLSNKNLTKRLNSSLKAGRVERRKSKEKSRISIKSSESRTFTYLCWSKWLMRRRKTSLKESLFSQLSSRAKDSILKNLEAPGSMLSSIWQSEVKISLSVALLWLKF